MKAIIENCMIVEVNTVPGKDNRVFPKLILCELDKPFSDLKRVNINNEEVQKLRAHQGQIHDVMVEAQDYPGKNGRYTVYSFIGFQKKADVKAV